MHWNSYYVPFLHCMRGKHSYDHLINSLIFYERLKAETLDMKHLAAFKRYKII